IFFFFSSRRRHTRSDRDWSSDVCSSDLVQWMHGEVGERGMLPLAEAEAVVRSLSLAMHGERHMLVPLLELREFDEYTTTHSLNRSEERRVGKSVDIGDGRVMKNKKYEQL